MPTDSPPSPEGPPGPSPEDRVTVFGPDFPFAYDSWLSSPSGIGSIPQEKHGAEVAIIGAGLSGMVAAYELMRLGLRPVIYESSRMGGRLRSERFSDGGEAVAELGGNAVPGIVVDLLPLCGQAWLGIQALPQSADLGSQQHCGRPGRANLVCRKRRRPARAVPGSGRRLGCRP